MAKVRQREVQTLFVEFAGMGADTNLAVGKIGGLDFLQKG